MRKEVNNLQARPPVSYIHLSIIVLRAFLAQTVSILRGRKSVFGWLMFFILFCIERLPSLWRLSSTVGLAVQRMWALLRQVPDQVCITVLFVLFNAFHCKRTSSFAAVLIFTAYCHYFRRGSLLCLWNHKLCRHQRLRGRPLWKLRGFCCTCKDCRGPEIRVRFRVP